ncbi:MAG: DMT family transporter [Clostridia bacterium]|nr:DMT family transporter [Clostridia bacterium]
MKNKKLIGSLCIIGTTIGYALVPSLSFLAFQNNISSETILFNKFLYASIMVWAYIAIKRLPFRLNRKSVKGISIVSLAYVGINTTLYLAFDYISGSLATIISFSFPIFVIVLEMIRGREKKSFVKILAVLLCLCGLGITVWSPGLEINMIGVMFALMCALFYTVYTIGLSSESLDGMNSIVTAGYVLLTSAVVNGVRCGVAGEPMFSGSYLIFLLALACAFAPILLFCVGVKMIGPSNAAIINTSEPAFACVFGFLLVGDIITPAMIIGGAIVIASVLFINIMERKASSSGSKDNKDLKVTSNTQK